MTTTTIPERREWISIAKLKVHPTIQRQFQPGRAESYAQALNVYALGELHIQEDGKRNLWIVDGQHRRAAVELALGANQEMYCHVFQTDDTAAVAKISLDLNSSRRWSPIDRYKVRVTAREWRALAIHGVLHQYDLRVDQNRKEGTVQAVSVCDWIVDQGGQAALTRTIRILAGAWGRDPDAYHASLLKAIGGVVIRYNGDLVDDELIPKLQKTGGPGRMIGRIRDAAKFHGYTIARSGAEVVCGEYNKGRRNKGVLPPWNPA